MKKAAPIIPIAKPNKTLDELILGQSSSTGAWSDKSLVLSFFKDALAVESQRNDIESLVTGSDNELVWLTILALFILSKKFPEKESEWQLIANKAKTFIKAQGIPKPDTVVKSLKFEIN